MFKKLISRLSNDLSQGFNPYIYSALGIVTVFYAAFLMVPKTNAYTLITYNLFTTYNFNLIFFTAGLIIGLWVFLTPAFAQKISKMIMPLYLMSVYWFSIATFIIIGNWHSNSWILPIAIAILSLMAAANYRVNKNSDKYKNVFKK